jgi:hypothetical protein
MEGINWIENLIGSLHFTSFHFRLRVASKRSKFVKIG